MIYTNLRRLAVRFAIARNVSGRFGRAPRALVSYIVHPFLPFIPSRHHTNVQEAKAIVEVLDAAGYSVDVVDSRASPLRVSKNYDLYFGFGNALERVAQDLRPTQRLIAYATGRAAPYQAAESLRRGFEFNSTYGHFPKSSLRLPGALWHWQIAMADALVIVGDSATASTFGCYPAHSLQRRRTIPATFAAGAKHTAALVGRDWQAAKFNLLWFGGAGVVHKGLDLCIAALHELPQLTLHVCGVSDRERQTVERCLEYYKPVASRVRLHGYMHPHSRDFGALASRCAFTILPSCSEGQATSVLTSVACGELIPLVSDRCGCNELPGAFFIKELTVASVVDTIESALEIDAEQLRRISSDCANYVRTHHGIDNFKEALRGVMHEVIERQEFRIDGTTTNGNNALQFRTYSIGGRPIFSAPPGLRLAAIQRLQPTTTRRGMYRRILRLSMFANIDTWLGTKTDHDLPLDGELDFSGWMETARKALGVETLEPVVFWPRQRDRGRIYVHLFEAGFPIAFAKVSLSTRPDGALRREGAALQSLNRQTFTHFHVPRLLSEGYAPARSSNGASSGCSYLLMEPVPPSARPIRGNWQAFPRKSVEEYAGTLRFVSFAEISALSWWEQYRASVSDNCRHFDEELFALLQDGMSVCRAHGDLGVNNIVNDGGRLWIYDWEESRPDAPVMTDAIGYALSTEFRTIVRNPKVGMRLLRRKFLQAGSATSKLDLMLALAFRHSAGIYDASAIVQNWMAFDDI